MTIDERPDGTYLIFKHQGDMNHRFEIMVSADKAPIDIEYWKSKSNFAFNPACDTLFVVLMDILGNALNIQERQIPPGHPNSFGRNRYIDSYDS